MFLSKTNNPKINYENTAIFVKDKQGISSINVLKQATNTYNTDTMVEDIEQKLYGEK